MIPNEKRLVDLTVGELRQVLKIERDASASKIEHPSPPNENEFLEMEAAAKVLHVSKNTLYGITSRKEIKYTKRGKNLFKMADLINYLQEGEIETMEEMETQMNNSLLGKRNKNKF